jgi:hypothetical protein
MSKPIIDGQDKYCRDCLCLPGCNVILKEGEICGDKVIGLSDLSYDEWESLGDNVPAENNS